MKRRSGILLHVSSLPGNYHIGDFGSEARNFIDWLEAAGQSLWQILPLLPPDDIGSPYASHSANGISSLFISPDDLLARRLLDKKDIPKKSHLIRVNYSLAAQTKHQLVRRSYEHFLTLRRPTLTRSFKRFCLANKDWLEDHALFDAIKQYHEGKPWFSWRATLRHRDTVVLKQARLEFAYEIDREKYAQWIAHQQWFALKRYANKKGVKIVGDIPFFVRHDSVDVWANQDKYLLNAAGQPKVMAGVPPDMFSTTGQHWGNPMYNWQTIKKDDYSWWSKRIGYYATLFDILRIDHFRGYAALWHIPARAKDARTGKWVKTPGKQLLQKLFKAVGQVPMIAEDIGFITKDVLNLRDAFHIPGSRVIIFGFGGGKYNPSKPENFPVNSVAYTSTHDTNTAKGWLTVAPAAKRRRALAYTKVSPDKFSRVVIKNGINSRAQWFIMALQDVFNLGKSARMNTPTTTKGNWQWRLDKHHLTKNSASLLLRLTQKAKR